jgi:phage gp46-like protein
MTIEGDVHLFNNENGGDINITNGIMELDSGLSTSVYISLFSSKNWWGNLINNDDQQLKSDLNTILSRKLNNQTRLDAIVFAKRALDWMIEQNIAKTIDVEGTIPRVETLLLEIIITQPDEEQINLKYEINWQKQISNPIN